MITAVRRASFVLIQVGRRLTLMRLSLTFRTFVVDVTQALQDFRRGRELRRMRGAGDEVNLTPPVGHEHAWIGQPRNGLAGQHPGRIEREQLGRMFEELIDVDHVCNVGVRRQHQQEEVLTLPRGRTVLPPRPIGTTQHEVGHGIAALQESRQRHDLIECERTKR